MNQYKIKLIKHFEITVEVTAENAIMAQRKATDDHPGYTPSQITWLNAPPQEPIVKKPRVKTVKSVIDAK
jgi:hypothetical protein